MKRSAEAEDQKRGLEGGRTQILAQSSRESATLYRHGELSITSNRCCKGCQLEGPSELRWVCVGEREEQDVTSCGDAARGPDDLVVPFFPSSRNFLPAEPTHRPGHVHASTAGPARKKIAVNSAVPFRTSSSVGERVE
jgi:hypothetical protein